MRMSQELTRLALTPTERERLFHQGAMAMVSPPIHGNSKLYVPPPGHSAKFDRHLKQHFAKLPKPHAAK